MKRILPFLTAALIVSALPLRAEVTDSAAGGFTVKTVTPIAAPPRRVYDVVVREFPKWWDAGHSFSGKSYNLSMSDQVGGGFHEKLGDEGFVRHLSVVYADPGKLLRLTGALGPLQEMAVTGTLSLTFDETEAGTSLVAVYRVGGYYPPGLDTVAGAVDGVISEQFKRLKDWIESDGN